MTAPLSIARSRGGMTLLCAALAAGCDDHAPPARTAHRDAAVKAAAASASPPVARAPADAETVAPAARDSGSKAPLDQHAAAAGKVWIFDRAVDVGPAGPASASEHGVVFITSADEVALAALDKPKRSATPPGTSAPVKTIADGTSFRHSTRPPVVLGQYAYWVSGGRLLRRALAAGAKLEVLRGDARTGTQASGALLGKTPHVVYITQSASGDPRARLWIEGQALVDLTPEGSSASSTALLAQSGGSLLFLALEGRSAMSPVHARRIRVHAGRPELEPDRVLWVGGAAQGTTELDVLEDANADVWALVPLERSATEFGLASIPVTRDAMAADAVTWTAYANGLDRPALATGPLCGRAAVLTARPSTARPSSDQKLHLSTLEGGVVTDQAVVLEARRIRDLSLATWAGGGLLALVADGRTLAVTVRCASPGRSL